MGLFDFLTNAQKKMTDLQKRFTDNTVLQREKKNKKPDCATQILAQRDSFKRNGFKEYTFIANRECCSVCGELNGKHFPVSQLKIGVNAPPMHEGCRCSIAAYSDRSEYEKWLNSF